MDKLYSIKEDTLQRLANTIRHVNGKTSTYTPDEMIEAVTTIMDSITYLLVDENGMEIPAVFVDNETIFTATADDIRDGKIAANQNGIVEGTKYIPDYRAEEGIIYVKPGNPIEIGMFSDMCEFTELQAIMYDWNSYGTSTVDLRKVVVDGYVYDVGNAEPVSKVTVDSETQTIKFGVVNDGIRPLVVRYMIIKEDVEDV